MFQIEHISKSYGKKQVLNDISLWFQTEVQLGFLGLTVPENPRCFPVLQKNILQVPKSVLAMFRRKIRFLTN